MLSKNEVLAYKKKGAYYPISIFSEEETKHYLKQFEQLETLSKEKNIPLIQPQLHFGWVYRLTVHPKILDVMEAILGTNILVHSVTFFAKSANHGNFVSWHQDGYYWHQEQQVLASAWLALTPSTPENGCMRVIPGTHVTQLEHGETAVHEKNLLGTGLQVAAEIDESLAEDVILEPGQISLHNGNILHGSNANNSNTRRIGLAIRYLPTGIRQKRVHHQVILARGVDEFQYFDLLKHPPMGSLEEGLRKTKQFRKEWNLAIKKQSEREGRTYL